MRLAPLATRMLLLLLAGCSTGPKTGAAVDATLAPAVLAGVPSPPAPLPLESHSVTLKRELCRRSIERAPDDPDAKCALAKVREIGDGTYVALLYRGPEAWKEDEAA